MLPITVITATFNAEASLPDLIRSLRSQTRKDFQWIVADGGSTDATLALLGQEADLVSRLLRGPDFGIYHALNKAIAEVQTPYYLVLGADDTLEPDAIEQFAAAVERSGADLITADVRTSAGMLTPGRGKRWRNGHLAYISQHSVGTLVKTSLHKTVGPYSRAYPIAADRHFLLSAIEKHHCTIHPAKFVAGTYGEEGVSSRQYYAALMDVYKVDFALSDHPRRTAVVSLLKYASNLGKFSR